MPRRVHAALCRRRGSRRTRPSASCGLVPDLAGEPDLTAPSPAPRARSRPGACRRRACSPGRGPSQTASTTIAAALDGGARGACASACAQPSTVTRFSGAVSLRRTGSDRSGRRPEPEPSATAPHARRPPCGARTPARTSWRPSRTGARSPADATQTRRAPRRRELVLGTHADEQDGAGREPIASAPRDQQVLALLAGELRVGVDGSRGPSSRTPGPGLGPWKTGTISNDGFAAAGASVEYENVVTGSSPPARVRRRAV